MKDLLKKFENKNPEIIFQWQDSETEAKGWVVINSLRGGAAGGGTRMRIGLDQHEVTSLAKTMEVKFTVSGPPIGGAKSGINFDPTDPRKKGVLKRWYEAVTPLLKYYYGTGGDLNVDEIHEVNRIGQLRQGVLKAIESENYSPDIEKKFVVADMITGYGVAESVKHYYNIYGGKLQNKKVVVQGWGNVGSAAAYYISQEGAKIVGIIDKDGGLIKEDGFSFEEIKDLYIGKKGNTLHHSSIQTFDEVNNKIWDLKSEIFLPCAASRLINKNQVERMIKSGIEVIAPGANVPFADKEIFFGPISDFTDQNISLIPDFISNCGMARVFAYLMGNDLEKIEDEAIFIDTSETIKKALKDVFNKNSSKTDISKTAFEIALKQLI